MVGLSISSGRSASPLPWADAVGVVRVVVREQDTVETAHAGRQELVAQVWRGIDQDRGRSLGSEPFDQDDYTPL